MLGRCDVRATSVHCRILGTGNREQVQYQCLASSSQIPPPCTAAASHIDMDMDTGRARALAASFPSTWPCRPGFPSSAPQPACHRDRTSPGAGGPGCLRTVTVSCNVHVHAHALNRCRQCRCGQHSQLASGRPQLHRQDAPRDAMPNVIVACLEAPYSPRTGHGRRCPGLAIATIQEPGTWSLEPGAWRHVGCIVASSRPVLAPTHPRIPRSVYKDNARSDLVPRLSWASTPSSP